MSTRCYIFDGKRTGVGSFQGGLSHLSSPILGGHLVKEMLGSRPEISKEVTDVFMGCVLQAGLGQSPVRQMIHHSGLGHHVHGVTINKVCGSSLEAISFARSRILIDEAKLAIACGAESMSRAPYILPQGRKGYGFGHGQVLDHMMWDGLQDGITQESMGLIAEKTASDYNFSRQKQEEYVFETARKALFAEEKSLFSSQRISVPGLSGQPHMSIDEPLLKVKLDKIPLLKPAFLPNGSITAATSSSLSDGAAALLMGGDKIAQDLSLTPMAYIEGVAYHSQDPQGFTTAPIGAIQKLLEKLNWKTTDVDAYEINEAFAVVPMAAIKDLSLDRAHVNHWGGACVLGHPIGASGARIVVTLLHILKSQGGKKGVATACIGGGEAIAIGIKMM
jgi:acetyl-CoA C-acetyltransferase